MYAVDELHDLMNRLSKSGPDKDHLTRYICALISELAYHHVPQFEIDDKKRAQVIPCLGYREIVVRGSSTSVVQLLQELDFVNAFVVIDRAVIAVGIIVNQALFIGFRGTQFLYDWRINFRSRLVDLGSGFFSNRRGFPYGYAGRVHRGYAEEAIRISAKIAEIMSSKGLNNIKQVYLAGHSLGGAVAALSEDCLAVPANTETIIMGAPRYADAAFYFKSLPTLPTQIQRDGDIVPFVPPKCFGYADHPRQYAPNGLSIDTQTKSYRWAHISRNAALFAARRCEPHEMEAYRRDLGSTAGAHHFDKPLAPYEKLASISA